MADIWQVLQIPEDSDLKTVKRAYAKLIKQFRPDTHPEEFNNIRGAYEAARAHCAYTKRMAQIEAEKGQADRVGVEQLDAEYLGETPEQDLTNDQVGAVESTVQYPFEPALEDNQEVLDDQSAKTVSNYEQYEQNKREYDQSNREYNDDNNGQSTVFFDTESELNHQEQIFNDKSEYNPVFVKLPGQESQSEFRSTDSEDDTSDSKSNDSSDSIGNSGFIPEMLSKEEISELIEHYGYLVRKWREQKYQETETFKLLLSHDALNNIESFDHVKYLLFDFILEELKIRDTSYGLKSNIPLILLSKLNEIFDWTSESYNFFAQFDEAKTQELFDGLESVEKKIPAYIRTWVATKRIMDFTVNSGVFLFALTTSTSVAILYGLLIWQIIVKDTDPVGVKVFAVAIVTVLAYIFKFLPKIVINKFKYLKKEFFRF